MRLVFLFCLLPFFGITQLAERAVINLSPEHFSNTDSEVYDINGNIIDYFFSSIKQTDWIKVPIETTPFLAFSIAWKNSINQTTSIYYRFSNKAKDWTLIEVDPHYNSINNRKVGNLIFADKEEKNIQIKIIDDQENSTDIESIELHFFSPGINTSEPIEQVGTTTQSCPCPQPAFLDRQGWCPNGDCPEHSNPQATNVTHLIVHHAASTNASSNWSGVVRSIWDFHVNTNGWDDIGYNWLIDPNGVVYEGRGDNIQGAHFCGNNGGTAGICMLGDFSNTTPAPEAIDKLTAFLSWKACDANLDPEGTAFHSSSNQNLPLIAGHREGCSTECPGNQFFPLFPQLRSDVKDFQDQACDEFPPPSNLTAWATSESSIQLQWEDNSTSETNFLVERSKNNNSSFTQIAQLPNNSTFYTDTGLTPFTAYFYRVRAAAGSNFSDYSNEVGAATVLTDLDQIENANNISRVMPNPSSGIVRLNLQGSYRGVVNAQLYDVAYGRVYQQWNFWKSDFSFEEELNLKKIGTGVFILRLEMEGKISYLKILRQ